jgi:hypothetical protein
LWFVYAELLHIVLLGKFERAPVTGRLLILDPPRRMLAQPRAERRRRHGFQPTRLRRFRLNKKRRQALARPSASAPVTWRRGTIPLPQEPRSGYPSRNMRWSLSRLALRRLSQSVRYRSDTVTLAHDSDDDKTQFRSYPPLARPTEHLSTEHHVPMLVSLSRLVRNPRVSTNF